MAGRPVLPEREQEVGGMATYVERRGLADEAEPVGLLTEGAAGIAVIVLSIIALAAYRSRV
jgi:hypothetical protein